MTHEYEPPLETKSADKSSAGAGKALQQEADSSRFVNSIDKTLKNCLDNARSNDESASCGATAEHAWDKVLNEAYKELRAPLTAHQKNELQNAEAKWIKFRDQEFKSISQIYTGQGEGTMTHPWVREAQANLVKERAIELQNRAGNDTNGSVASRSQTNNPPDIAKANCSMMEIDCLGANFDDWDKTLNQNYQDLKSILNKDGQEQLLKSEREWINFKDAEFSFIDSIYDSRYAGNRQEALQAKTDIVRERALHLQHQKEVVIDG